MNPRMQPANAECIPGPSLPFPSGVPQALCLGPPARTALQLTLEDVCWKPEVKFNEQHHYRCCGWIGSPILFELCRLHRRVLALSVDHDSGAVGLVCDKQTDRNRGTSPPSTSLMEVGSKAIRRPEKHSPLWTAFGLGAGPQGWHTQPWSLAPPPIRPWARRGS